MSTDQRSILANAGIFEGLDSAQIDALARMAVRKTYRTREIVLRKGDPAMQMYVIAKGRLKAITAGAEGRQAALSIMGPGEVFGEVALLDGEPRSATITALEPCELIILNRNDFYHFLERNPSAAIGLLQVLARQPPKRRPRPLPRRRKRRPRLLPLRPWSSRSRPTHASEDRHSPSPI
ncbi:MAG: cyclic nucleotide-binding domain-containing protein, partial [Polyangiaceae bacterium]